MADKQEINKELADSKRYYNLLMSKVGQIKNGDNILLVHIGNLDVIRKIVDNYPEGNYIIVDKKCYGPVLSLLYPAFQEEKQFIATQEDTSIIEALQFLTMKFDKIIMNPPYGKNLHLKILEEALKHLSQDGHCVNLSPIRWLQDPLAKYKKSSDLKKFEESVAKHIEILEIIEKSYSNSVFNVSAPTLGIYVAKSFQVSSGAYKEVAKASTILLRIVDMIFNKQLTSLDGMLVFDDMSGICISMTKIVIDERHPETRKKFGMFVHGKDKLFYTGKKNEAFGETYFEYRKRVSWGNNKPKAENWNIKFNTAIERENFFNSYRTEFMKYIFCQTIVDVHIHYEFLPWMGDSVNPRTGLKGYLGEWTDEDFYTYFNITEEEQKLIEETMEKY